MINEVCTEPIVSPQTLTTVHHDNWEQDYTEYIDGHLMAYMTTYFTQHIV